MSGRNKKGIQTRPLVSPPPSEHGGRSPSAAGRRPNQSKSGLSDEDSADDRGRSPSGRKGQPRGIQNVLKGSRFRSSSSSSQQSLKLQPKTLAVKDCLNEMVKFIDKHGLRPIYGKDITDEALRDLLKPSAEAAAQLPINIPYVNRELAMRLAILSLYDLAVLVDDSISMEFEEEGIRKEVLKSVLYLLAEIFEGLSVEGQEKRGIRSIRFLNDNSSRKDTAFHKDEIADIIDNHEFEGLTRIGTGLMQKILKPLLYQPGWKKEDGIARTLQKLQRPLLIMVVTDGAIEGEHPNRLKQAINSVIASLKKAQFPDHTKAVVFQFARVGNDPDAQMFLEKMDSSSQVSKIMDTLSSEDLVGAGGAGEITDQQRLIKLFLGPISPAYDKIASKVKGDTVNEDDDAEDDFDDGAADDDDEQDANGNGARPDVQENSDDDFQDDE